MAKRPYLSRAEALRRIKAMCDEADLQSPEADGVILTRHLRTILEQVEHSSKTGISIYDGSQRP